MSYRNYIESKKAAWIGKKVKYHGESYTVIDVDYNGLIRIDLPAEFTNTTAIETFMLDKED